MVVHHGVQRALQCPGVEVVGQVEQHRHAEVAQRPVRGEEPLLDRGERGGPVLPRAPGRGYGGGAAGRGGGQVGDRLVPEDVL